MSPSLARAHRAFQRKIRSQYDTDYAPLILCSRQRRIVNQALQLIQTTQVPRLKFHHSPLINCELDPMCGQCSVKGICAKVKEQVGFLLDSKCYPFLSNE